MAPEALLQRQERCRSVLSLQKYQFQRPVALRERRGSGCSVPERYRSDLQLQTQQLERPEALLERSVVPQAAVAASRSVAGASCGSRSGIGVVVAVSRSVTRLSVASAAAGGNVQEHCCTFCGLRCSSCRVWERCRTVLGLQKQLLKRPGALQESLVRKAPRKLRAHRGSLAGAL